MAPTPAKPRYWACRPMGYDRWDLDRGQVFELTGQRNDEKLKEYRYCQPIEARAETFTCADCGAEFIDLGSRTMHGHKRHRPQSDDPREQDRMADREEKMLTEVAPLNVPGLAATIGR